MKDEEERKPISTSRHDHFSGCFRTHRRSFRTDDFQGKNGCHVSSTITDTVLPAGNLSASFQESPCRESSGHFREDGIQAPPFHSFPAGACERPGDRHSSSSWNDKNSTYIITLINTTIQGILMKKAKSADANIRKEFTGIQAGSRTS